jgi:hypothetical protein
MCWRANSGIWLIGASLNRRSFFNRGGLSTLLRDASAGIMVLSAVVDLDSLDGTA